MLAKKHVSDQRIGLMKMENNTMNIKFIIIIKRYRFFSSVLCSHSSKIIAKLHVA